LSKGDKERRRKMMTMEMKILMTGLANRGIEFQVTNQVLWNDAPQICIPSEEEKKIDFVCHEGSYGGNEGLLEVYFPEIEDVVGYLTGVKALAIVDEYFKYGKLPEIIDE
jgi:hypothetical protein